MSTKFGPKQADKNVNNIFKNGFPQKINKGIKYSNFKT